MGNAFGFSQQIAARHGKHHGLEKSTAEIDKSTRVPLELHSNENPMTSAPPSKRCFVISPIGPEGSDIRKHADEVFEFLIAPVLEGYGITPIRSDQIREPGKISDQMYREIFAADLCIAVLTDSNPNVYYELAVAQAASRPVITLIKKGQPLPFDVRDLRTIEYDLSLTTYKSGADRAVLTGFLQEFSKRDWRGDDIFQTYRRRPSIDNIVDPDHFGISIQSPKNGSVVDIVNVEGKFDSLPLGYELRGLRYYPKQNGYIPINGIRIDQARRTWNIPRFDIGGISKEPRGIWIALAGPNARIPLEYWSKAHRTYSELMRKLEDAGGKHGTWLPPITDWPADLLVCARIDVVRK